MATIHGNKRVFGVKNRATFTRNPTGDITWYATESARGDALARMRAWAVRYGLSESASIASIYAVGNRAANVSTAIYLNADQTEWASRPGTW